MSRNKTYMILFHSSLYKTSKFRVDGNFVLLIEIPFTMLSLSLSVSLLNKRYLNRELNFRFESKHYWLITVSRIVASPHSMYIESTKQFFDSIELPLQDMPRVPIDHCLKTWNMAVWHSNRNIEFPRKRFILQPRYRLDGRKKKFFLTHFYKKQTKLMRFNPLTAMLAPCIFRNQFIEVKGNARNVINNSNFCPPKLIRWFCNRNKSKLYTYIA